MVRAKSSTRAPKNKAITLKSTDWSKHQIAVSAADVKKLRQFETTLNTISRKIEALAGKIRSISNKWETAYWNHDKTTCLKYKKEHAELMAKLRKEQHTYHIYYQKYQSFIHAELGRKKGYPYVEAARKKAWPGRRLVKTFYDAYYHMPDGFS